MLAAIRKFAQSWPARILMGLLAISFVGWGVNQGAATAMAPDQIIKAGSRTIGTLEFRREYDNFRKRMEEQSGQPITPEAAAANGMDKTVLEGVATREAFAEMLSKVGIRPSDKQILAQIEKIPAFFDQISGRFDRKTFEQRLGENGMTPETFDAGLRDEMAGQHWSVGVQHGLSAPRSYGALASVFSLESRDLTYFMLTPQSVPQPPTPTDAQLQAFMNENAAQLTLPESRVLTIVGFSPNPAAAMSGPVDPAELKKRYDFRKDTLSKPETRTIVQIPAKDAATAQQIVARLSAGEAPAAVAKAVGVDAITHEQRPMTAIPDKKVAQAAFALPEGKVAPVQGDLGVSVVKIIAVTPGRSISMDEARPMLEAEIRKDMVAEKVYAQTQAYEDAHQGGAALAEAVQKAGAVSTTLGPITAQGVDEKGRQLQGLPPKILELAFTLPAGGESDITELGDGSYFAVRVEKIVAPHVPPLAELRPMLTGAWMQRELVKQLEARAEGFVARLKKGEALAAVAASGGHTIVQVSGLSRQTAGARPDVPNEVLGRAFAGKPGEAWTARAPNGIVVGQVSNVRMEPGPTAARLAEANRTELAGILFREMAQSAQTYARAKLKVKTKPELARAALGFEPLETKGKPEKKK